MPNKNTVNQSVAYNYSYNLGAWIGGTVIAGVFIAGAVLWLPSAAILAIATSFSYLLFTLAGLTATMSLLTPLMGEDNKYFLSACLLGLLFFASMATACLFFPVFPLALIGFLVTAFGAGLGGLALGKLAWHLYAPQEQQRDVENYHLFANKDIQDTNTLQNNENIKTDVDNNNLVSGMSFFNQDNKSFQKSECESFIRPSTTFKSL